MVTRSVGFLTAKFMNQKTSLLNSPSRILTSFSGISELSEKDRDEWGKLTSHRPESAPFVDEKWIGSWVNAFTPPHPMLLCAREEGKLVGLAAVQALTELWTGRKIKVLQSLTNVWSYRFEFLSSHDRADVLKALWRALCEAGRWDVIRLDIVPEGSPSLTAGVEVARELGWNNLILPLYQSPWRALPQPPTPWNVGLNGKFKSNLRNRERRLNALGGVSFEVGQKRNEQKRALQIFYELEQSSWKGERGTAIINQRDTKFFFDKLVERATGDIWIPILSVSGRPVAAQLIRVCCGTMFLLKTAYHPDFSPYSPGQLITARVIKYGMERGIKILDFLGEQMTWKMDWVPDLRSNFQLVLCSQSFNGQYAYWMRYGIKKQLKKIPGAVSFARWLKEQRRG